MSPTRIASLPIELLDRILSDATSILDEFSTSPTSPIVELGSSATSDEEHRRRQIYAYGKLWREIADTRSSVALVDRLWRSIGVQYLFSSLYIDQRTDPARLHNTHTEGLWKRFCKRISFVDVVETQPFERFTARCTSLVQLTIAFSTGAALSGVPVTLKALYVDTDDWYPLTSHQPHLWARLPELQSLEVLHLQGWFEWDIDSDQMVHVSLPRLHTLSIHLSNEELSEWYKQWDLPCLSHLEIESAYDHSTIIAKHAWNLRSLRALSTLHDVIVPLLQATCSTSPSSLLPFLI